MICRHLFGTCGIAIDHVLIVPVLRTFGLGLGYAVDGLVLNSLYLFPWVRRTNDHGLSRVIQCLPGALPSMLDCCILSMCYNISLDAKCQLIPRGTIG